jgi:TetR/AcrR family transcriptional repressor of bet genes
VANVARKERGRPLGPTDPEARRQDFIDAVVRSIAQCGFEDLTVATICEAAGFSRGLIAHYFPGKDALLLRAVQELAKEFERASRAAVAAAGPNPFDRLHAVVDASFKPPIFTAEKVLVWVALASTSRWSPSRAGVYRNLYRPYRRSLSRLIRRAATECRVEINADRVALTLTQLVEGLWSGWAADPDSFSVCEAAAACHDLLNAYLGKYRQQPSLPPGAL